MNDDTKKHLENREFNPQDIGERMKYEVLI